MARSTVRYRRRPDRDYEVIALLSELAEHFPERGFGKLFQIIRRRGNNGSRFTSFVIKPLPHALRDLPGYAGATLVGDGRLDLVIS